MAPALHTSLQGNGDTPDALSGTLAQRDSRARAAMKHFDLGKNTTDTRNAVFVRTDVIESLRKVLSNAHDESLTCLGVRVFCDPLLPRCSIITFDRRLAKALRESFGKNIMWC